MSFIVSGVEMPESCWDCPCGIFIDDARYCSAYDCRTITVPSTRPDWCPLRPLPEQNVGQWIPVSERLPEEGCYLVTVDVYGERYVVETYFHKDRWMTNDRVVAWMPRPEPWEPVGDPDRLKDND